MTSISDSTFNDNGAVFDGGALSVQGTTNIRGSDFVDNEAVDFDGGAISGTGLLTVEDSTFEGNTAGDLGGAIHMDEELADQLNVTGSAFTENLAARGGAIYNAHATVTLDTSEFNGNSAAERGGGIYNDDGTLTITNSSLTENFAMAGFGGGIVNSAGVVDVSRTEFTANWSHDDGGGLYDSGGDITISESTFTENYSSRTDNVPFGRAGAVRIGGSQATITNSTFNGNWSDREGGAINDTGEDTTIISSTFSGNYTVTADGGGGGAIRTFGYLTIADSTFTLNDAGNDQGDGILNIEAGIPTVRNTIIANNDTAGSGQDCTGTLTSLGFNLDSDGSCTSQPSDVPNGDADLGPLTDNGGPTPTHLPGMTGDAFNSGGGCFGTDQRGRPRPVEQCEIGSVELQTAATYVLCANYYTGRVLSPYNGECGPGTFELNVPEIYPITFCIDAWTGAVAFTSGGPCNPPRQVHEMPEDGDLLACVSLYTGVNRRVYSEAQCLPYELPNLIPATL